VEGLKPGKMPDIRWKIKQITTEFSFGNLSGQKGRGFQREKLIDFSFLPLFFLNTGNMFGIYNALHGLPVARAFLLVKFRSFQSPQHAPAPAARTALAEKSFKIGPSIRS